MKPILSLAIAAALISTAPPVHARTGLAPAGDAAGLRWAQAQTGTPDAQAPDAGKRQGARPAPVQGLAGAYLAARQAAADSNFPAAARYFGEAVAADPGEAFLQDGALVSMISAGEIDRAVDLANRLAQTERAETELVALLRDMLKFSCSANMSGNPTITLPAGFTASGMPVGVQLVAAFGREDVLVRVASALEQAAPWADRRPALSA